jgi:hypothetical protein
VALAPSLVDSGAFVASIVRCIAVMLTFVVAAGPASAVGNNIERGSIAGLRIVAVELVALPALARGRLVVAVAGAVEVTVGKPDFLAFASLAWPYD